MPLTIDKFFIKTQKDISTLPGASAANGTLQYLHKKCAMGDDVKRSKYTSSHYLKATSHKKARSEVAVLEFLRLMIPRQPKTRLIKGVNNIYYVQSKEVQLADPLWEIDCTRYVGFSPGSEVLKRAQEIHDKAKADTYGNRYNGFKGLGELNFLMCEVFYDTDIAGRNYLANTFGSSYIYRIDGGRTEWHREKCFRTFNNYFLLNQRSQNRTYIDERNKAILQFLTLPSVLIQAFCDSYFLSDQSHEKAELLIKRQQEIRNDIIRTDDTLNPYPMFYEYVSSKQAHEHLELYTRHLAGFNISGKNNLVSRAFNWKDDMLDQHLQLVESLSYQKELTTRFTTDLDESEAYDYDISSLESNYSTLRAEDKKSLTEALRILGNIWPKFNRDDLDKLYKIEMINPYYFPRLSCAAAKTLCVLHTANPQLEISFLLDTVYNLADRRRPWESLDAFRMIAELCPKQITRDNIAYLRKVNSDILEICPYNIEKKTKQKSTKVSRLPDVTFRFFTPAEVNIREEVQAIKARLSHRGSHLNCVNIVHHDFHNTMK